MSTITPLLVEVAERVEEAPGIISIVLRPIKNGDTLPAWTPGAHIDVYWAGRTQQYSLSGHPADETWRITISPSDRSDSVSGDLVSSVSLGDRLQVGVPRNNFALRDAANYVFIAGGIGITPIIPMLVAAEAKGANWQLHYAVRNPEAYAFSSVLKLGGEKVHLWSRSGTGRLDLAAVLTGATASAEIYCCGPQRMIDEALSTAAKLNLGHRLHVERFVPVEVDRAADAKAPFSVKCALSDVEFQVGADESLLDVMIAHGVFVPSSCREGTCGSCETFVLEGDIDHRDSILSEVEKAANDRMFVCVSRCNSPKLVLEV